MVDRYHNPSLKEFTRHREYPDYPVVLDGLITDWAAMHKWSISYLQKRWENCFVRACTQENGEHRYDRSRPVSMQFGTLLEHISRNDGTERKFFLSQLRILEHLPEAFDDIGIPRCISTDNIQMLSLWMGAKDTCTHLHWDSNPVLLALIRGRKKVRLFSPALYESMYPVSVFETKLNWSQVDFLRLDSTRFPAYAKAAFIDVELKAGETLYIPQYWWHFVHNPEFALGIQFFLSSRLCPASWASFYHHRQAIYAARSESIKK